jgi:aconitate hydratase
MAGRFDPIILENFEGTGHRIVSLERYAQHTGGRLDRLPRVVRILLEASLRGAIQGKLSPEESQTAADWSSTPHAVPDEAEIRFPIGRVILQDAAGLPLLVDLAALRDRIAEAGGNPGSVQPTLPVALVVDHSVQVDSQGSESSLQTNLSLEMGRNRERYAFLRWASAAFQGLEVVPPGNGIIHQIHMENLAQVVVASGGWLGFDTVIGTDSHTTMIGGLGVLGWGVGGIEAEAAILGLPQSIARPDVVGLHLTGSLTPPAAATDLVLSLTARLRAEGVVGALIEVFGDGCAALTASDRATIANMAPEFGATCVYFSADDETLRFLAAHGRSTDQLELVRTYLEHQGLFGTPMSAGSIDYSRVIAFDLSTVGAVVAGPSRPQDVVPLPRIGAAFSGRFPPQEPRHGTAKLRSGDVVIAAITSCTNTANPNAMVTAGLLARNAVALGLSLPDHVRPSFSPGSRRVPAYLERADLLRPLATLGFHIDAFGCGTCVGNSGELRPDLEAAVRQENLAVAAVLSGNRNFEARVHPLVKANFLMSPALVVAFALAGSVRRDLSVDPLATDKNGKAVYLRDLWPDPSEIENALSQASGLSMASRWFEPEGWDGKASASADVARYPWSAASTHFIPPPFFRLRPSASLDLIGARPLLVLGDSVTTDHISPVGRITPGSPAAAFLEAHGAGPASWGTYASRRGNHDVMVRGTFGNVRLANKLVAGREGPWSRALPGAEPAFIHEVAAEYQAQGRPAVVIAGRDYGSGSARDWAAKGTRLLGIRAVLARSFERIHRSNLILMGVAPVELSEDLVGAFDWSLASDVSIDLSCGRTLRAGADVTVAVRVDGEERTFKGRLRADTPTELQFLRDGGLFATVLDRYGVQRPDVLEA